MLSKLRSVERDMLERPDADVVIIMFMGTPPCSSRSPGARLSARSSLKELMLRLSSK